MKKSYPLFVSLLFFSGLRAQEFKVSAGTDLYISPGTLFSAGGLTLNPSAAFVLNGLSLSKTTTVTHSTANTYISRVYRFSGNTPAFSGSIQMNYLDGELNGIAESSLRLNVHNGSVWQAFGNNTNDATNNFVLTSALSSQVLNELTLADASHPLPLQWGTVTASRQGGAVTIEWTTHQEYNVSHFDVQRSTDALQWTTIIAHIPASNTSFFHRYTVTDASHDNRRLYYRIQQRDIDGRLNYSSIAVVAPDNSQQQVLLYPNPVNAYFTIVGVEPALIDKVMLYNTNGLLVKAWTSAQGTYHISSVAKGAYQVRIQTTDGKTFNQKIIVL